MRNVEHPKPWTLELVCVRLDQRLFLWDHLKLQQKRWVRNQLRREGLHSICAGAAHTVTVTNNWWEISERCLRHSIFRGRWSAHHPLLSHLF